MRPRYAVLAVIVLLAAALAFLQPIFSGIHNWGIYDWDQHFFYHGAPRVSLLSFGQFPLWTPYHCGGNVLLANPQSPFLSPFFIPVLLFGSVVGLKVEVLLYFSLGLLGMFMAARRLGCGRAASMLAAFVFMFSSWFAARVAVGHTTFFPFALLPFVFLFYLHSAAPGQLAGRVRWAVAAAFVLAVMFLSGGIYPFYAAALLLVFHSVLDFFGARSLRPVILVLAILALAVILSSVKLLPVLDFAGGAVPEKDVQLTTGSILFSSLLSRQQSIVPNDMETGRDLVAEGRQKELDTLAGNLPWGWHEYSAYIGVIPAILVALAAALGFRRNWKLAVSALFFFLLAIGSYFPVGPWQLVREIPFFSSLHGPSRFMIVFVLFAALLAARALSSLRVPGGSRVNAAVTAAILLVVVADLFLVSRPLLLDAFPLQPLEVRSTNIGSPEIIQMYSSAPSLSQYPNLLQGIGTVNCYERLHLRIRAVPQFVDGEPYNGFIGNAYIAETNETLNFTLFTPQKVSLRLSGIPMAESALSSGNVSELTLVINQNYYKGWALAGSLGEAGSHRGLLATLVKEKDLGKALTFSYSSRPFALGGVISLIGLIAALAAFWRPGRLRFLGPFGKKLESHVFRQS